MLKRNKVESFDEYPFTIPAVSNLESLEFHRGVTFLVGDNGTGKSTLLEAIAVASGFNPEGGTRNFNFSTHESHSSLHECLQLTKGIGQPKGGFFLRAESMFNVATEIDQLGVINSYGGVSLHEMSHGESFWALLMEKFHGQSLFLLDEPEAALSPTRQLAALGRIHDLVEDGAQFIIATHSPILMAYPGARIYAFSDSAITEVSYEDTEHYLVTRDFLNRRDAMLDEIMHPGGEQLSLDD